MAATICKFSQHEAPCTKRFPGLRRRRAAASSSSRPELGALLEKLGVQILRSRQARSIPTRYQRLVMLDRQLLHLCSLRRYAGQEATISKSCWINQAIKQSSSPGYGSYSAFHKYITPTPNALQVSRGVINHLIS